MTYDLVFFTVANTLPTPSPAPGATPTPAPTATPAASAQHLYMLVDAGIGEFALPITSTSTPIVTAPISAAASDSAIGPYLAVNAKHVIYADDTHDAYYVVDQPLSATSTPSTMFCYAICDDRGFNGTIMPLALSPFDSVAATDSPGPIAGQFLQIFNGPFSPATTRVAQIVLPSSGSGMAYDAAGALYVAGGATPSSGDLEEYAGTLLVAHVKTPIFLSSVAVNANEVAVAGSGNPCSGVVLIYTLPFTSSSTPSATITNGIGNTCGPYVALDAAGNLYVSGTKGGLSVYAPPLSNSSSPSTALPSDFQAQPVIGP